MIADGACSVLPTVLAVISRGYHRGAVIPDASLEHDLKIRGDDGDDLIDALSAEFGEWVCDWPWNDYLNLNEPPTSGLDWIRFLMPRAWWPTTFPHVREYKRMTPRHIAAVIEKGEWLEP